MKSSDETSTRVPFIDHVHELRRRSLACAVLVAAGTGLGYYLNELLVRIIQEPLGEKLYFTSPTGGFNFIFVLCLAFGVLVSLPFIFYQILAFLHPILSYTQRAMRFWYPACSMVLAIFGVSFAYFVSLPLALQFLTAIGSGTNIESLITTDAYFRFALTYLIGFAILFQLPLLLVIIDRITPLKPTKLMKAQKYVILGSFIIAAILTPTPDPLNQLLMAGPIIVLYQISALIIWGVHVHRNKMEKRKIILPVAKPVYKTSMTESVLSQPPVSTVVPNVAVTAQINTNRFISDIYMSTPPQTTSVRSRQTQNLVIPPRNKSVLKPSRPVGDRWSGQLIDVTVSSRRPMPSI